MFATAFQFTSEPAASHIANLVSLAIPLKFVKFEHPGSEFHGSMQSLCKVLEHADCDSFVLSHLAGSRLRVAQQDQLQFSCSRQGQFNVPVVADPNSPHDSTCAAGGPCLMTICVAGCYSAWSACMIGAASGTGPGAALMAPLCGATLASCQAVCLGTLARQLMTPAGISGTGLAEVVHVVTDFVLKWSSETIACIAGHAEFSCPPSLPRNLSSLFFQMECILPVACVSIEKTKNTNMQIAILQSTLKSGPKSGLKPTARLIPPHSDLISDLKKQVRHQVRNFSWAHPTIFRT